MSKKRKFKFGKLVRDKIVDKIIADGGEPKYHTLNDDEFIPAVKTKMLEEAKELSISEGEDLIEELADIQELIDTILKQLQISKDEFAAIQETKNEHNGSFNLRYFIDYTEAAEGTGALKYYLQHPEKNPEIK